MIAADGIHSTLQQFVVAPSAPLSSGSVAYRGVVSAASVSWPAGAMRNWLGAGKHFLVFPVRAGELINYVGFVPTDEQMKESWSAPGDPASLAMAFAGWDPMVEAIIAQVKHYVSLGPVRPRAALYLDSRAFDPTGRCRPPDAAARRAGSQSGHRGRRRLGGRAGHADRASAPRALQIYEWLRRERTAAYSAGPASMAPAMTPPAATSQPGTDSLPPSRRSAPGSGTTTPKEKP